MPKYLVSSDSEISVQDVGGGSPGHPWVPPSRPTLPPDWQRPELPPDWERPSLPPDFELPPLPPGLAPGPGHPIPPTPDHPWIPVDPAPEEPEVWPPPGVVWPPIRPDLPGLPDLSGKTLVLALLYVSRHAPRWGWVVIDHDEAKSFLEKVKDWLKAHWPAGGVGGRPPQTRPPA